VHVRPAKEGRVELPLECRSVIDIEKGKRQQSLVVVRVSLALSLVIPDKVLELDSGRKKRHRMPFDH
jgi:hypothetical protein